jgi:hypothetical protein
MPGGLIELITYGTQDLYLTGNPEITFFKIVYRRHTSFSMDSIEVPFDIKTGFKELTKIKIPKGGDLLSKLQLAIEIPEVAIERSNVTTADKTALETAQSTAYTNYGIIRDYIIQSMLVYIEAFDQYNSETGTATTMKTAIESKLTTLGATYTDAKALFKGINGHKVTISGTVYDYENVMCIDKVKDEYWVDNKIGFMHVLDFMVGELEGQQKIFHDLYYDAKIAYEDVNSDYVKFAWVERLGHAIIDYVKVEIGGREICKQYGDWLNIFFELSTPKDKRPDYLKLIGHDDSLITFDRTVKNSYMIHVPLQFWFCQDPTNALPLIALQNNDVVLEFKFRDISDCCYVEKQPQLEDGLPKQVSGSTVYMADEDQVDLDNLRDTGILDFKANLLCDFVYLEKDERKRFATVAHEYIIEQLQMHEEVITKNSPTIKPDFTHPCKYFIWTLQPESRKENLDGYTKCDWFNYALVDSNGDTHLPLRGAWINVNGLPCSLPIEAGYYNYVVPHKAFGHTPADGIFAHTFALHPLEKQPTGTCNASYIKRISLHLSVQNDADGVLGVKVDTEDETDPWTLRMYTVSLNVLRFIGGMGGTAFETLN